MFQIEPECQESLIQRKIHIQENSNKGHVNILKTKF